MPSTASPSAPAPAISKPSAPWAWNALKWFDQQLHPASIDETDLNARLAQFPDMQWNTEDLLYRLPSNAEIRQAMNTGRVPIPANGTLHAIYENQIYRLQAQKDEKARSQQLCSQAPARRNNPRTPAISPTCSWPPTAPWSR